MGCSSTARRSSCSRRRAWRPARYAKASGFEWESRCCGSVHDRDERHRAAVVPLELAVEVFLVEPELEAEIVVAEPDPDMRRGLPDQRGLQVRQAARVVAVVHVEVLRE